MESKMESKWVSINGQKINLERVVAIIDSGDRISFDDSGGYILAVTTQPGPNDGFADKGRVQKVTVDELEKIRAQISMVGDKLL